MKTWKRNAVIATVLLLVCAGIYLNWSYSQKQSAASLTDTLDEEQVMGDSTLVMSQSGENAAQTAAASAAQDAEAGADALAAADETAAADPADYFAQVRLSRQESRDSAVELLEQTIAYDDGTAVGDSASETLNSIVSTALSEAQIESLVIAKGYDDCVAYITDGSVCVAVSAPAEGLSDEDVALISDVVASQTDCSLSQLRIVEVKS